MDWKDSLDKYLTTEPDDGFTGWCESLIDKIPDSIYLENGYWFEDEIGLCNIWLNKLFNKGMNYEYAANIIIRAFYIYVKPSAKPHPYKRLQ